jgi:hydrogenase maturation protease
MGKATRQLGRLKKSGFSNDSAIPGIGGERMKTLVLGVGNPILTDDGIGIKIAQRLKEANPDLEVIETSEVGIAILDLIAMMDCDKLIIIDSVKTEQGKPGELYRFELEDLKPARDFSCSHGVDIATTFELGRRLGHSMPDYVSLYAIEVQDNTTFGEGCTEKVEERISFIAKQIMEKEKL